MNQLLTSAKEWLLDIRTSILTEIRDSFPYFLFTLAILFIPFYFYNKFDQKPETLPAWIQAVGTVLAIVVTFWVSKLNRKKEKQESIDNMLLILDATRHYILNIDKELKTIKESTHNFKSHNISKIYHRDILKAFGTELYKFDYQRIKSPEAILALTYLQAQTSIFLSADLDEILLIPKDIDSNKDAQYGRIQKSTIFQIKKLGDRFKEIYLKLDSLKEELRINK